MDQILDLVGLELGRRSVAPDDRLVEDLGAESADLFNLIVALEDRFGLEIGEEEAAAVRTVRDLLLLAEGRRPG